MRKVTGQDIVVVPISGERPATLPARRPSGIVVTRALPQFEGAARPRDAEDLRGRIVDILV